MGNLTGWRNDQPWKALNWAIIELFGCFSTSGIHKLQNPTYFKAQKSCVICWFSKRECFVRPLLLLDIGIHRKAKFKSIAHKKISQLSIEIIILTIIKFRSSYIEDYRIAKTEKRKGDRIWRKETGKGKTKTYLGMLLLLFLGFRFGFLLSSFYHWFTRLMLMLDELVGFLWYRKKEEDDDDAGDRGRLWAWSCGDTDVRSGGVQPRRSIAYYWAEWI